MPSITPDHLSYSPYPSQACLINWLEDTNHKTKCIIHYLRPGQEIVPMWNIVNPPYWEFGHISWFQEFWVHRSGIFDNPSWIPHADSLFDSSRVAHDLRWSLPIPSIEVLTTYFDSTMSRTRELLDKPLNEKQLYFIMLSIFHQDMHNEAFAYTWQTLGYPEPYKPKQMNNDYSATKGDIHFPSQKYYFGAKQNEGFIFDNEKWEHVNYLDEFSIASRPVTNGEYLEFLDACSKHWQALGPKYWRKDSNNWYERYFDQWLPLQLDLPVKHIRYDQAQQYCAWRKRRLPTEHELTLLHSSTEDTFQTPNLWEWSSSHFLPFPGFSEDPYRDYSSPWFDCKHQVLKGRSSFTADRLCRPQFRNFYLPERNDIFCGFRTCSI